MNRIHHVVKEEAWDAAMLSGSYAHPSLKSEGFIHFSTAEQLEGTLRKHYAGQRGLLLLTVDPVLLSAELKWEKSRGGALFPHLYGKLNIDAVTDLRPIDADDPLADLP